jgi:hypothetical protein
MDWKYKHFRQERIFPSSSEDVLAAARSELGNWGQAFDLCNSQSFAVAVTQTSESQELQA